MTSDAQTPAWLEDAIFYQIFPERFANGDHSIDPPDVVPWDSEPTRDNFFGGDLAGITSHLDHIESLGANAIYLTPIFEADTNHRYDGKDYFAVDHRLGDLDSFGKFIEEAHSRGIRVVLDAVFNHSGDGHWAFRDVVENEATSPYVNWYYVEGFPVVDEADSTPNYRTCSGCYYLPKWNAHNPAVRDHHYEVARYWIERGIDGWRLDVPYFINHSFWRGFRDVVKGADPELYIVAEEWREPEQWLHGDLADGTMNYTLRDLILGFTADRSLTAGQVADGLDVLRDRIPKASRPAMLNLLGSHDTERVLTRHGGRVDDLRLAYALLFVAQGAPMIYYGDEVGLAGANDPGCRGTMPWNEADWNHDVLESVSNLISLRRRHRPLRSGDQYVLGLSADVLAILRIDGTVAVLSILNRGDATVSVPESALSGELFGVSIDGNAWTTALQTGTVATSPWMVSARSILVLTTEDPS